MVSNKLRSGLMALALAASAISALAQPASYPVRPIHILVGGPAGVPADSLLRVISEPLAAELGQPIVIENRPGAMTTIALAAVARAPADGHTLGSLGLPGVVAPSLLDRALNPARDLATVRQVSWVAHVLVARPGIAATLDQLIARAKSEPAALTFASGGNGTPAHLLVEMLKQRAAIDLRHVPFNGPMAGVTALLGGHVDVMFASAPAVVGHVRSGKLQALAATGAARLAPLPDVPTLADLGLADLGGREWHGLVAPAGTPAAVLAKIAAALDKVLALDAVRERLAAIGMEAASPSDPSAFARLLEDDSARWSAVVKQAGIRAD